ncbi:MAG: hypothetical protein CL610_04985 [Anaerolineaceae bacterium]|nr:hypothetical protein [Anaerolineaceae bacterium]
MQISRHWRLNAQRYRLEGFRNPNGQFSLQPRRLITQSEQGQVVLNKEAYSYDQVSTVGR